jgi:hypothetical protein
MTALLAVEFRRFLGDERAPPARLAQPVRPLAGLQVAVWGLAGNPDR